MTIYLIWWITKSLWSLSPLLLCRMFHNDLKIVNYHYTNFNSPLYITKFKEFQHFDNMERDIFISTCLHNSDFPAFSNWIINLYLQYSNCAKSVNELITKKNILISPACTYIKQISILIKIVGSLKIRLYCLVPGHKICLTISAVVNIIPKIPSAGIELNIVNMEI